MTGHSMGIPFEFVPLRLDASLMATVAGLAILLSAWAISQRRGTVVSSTDLPSRITVPNATGTIRGDLRGKHFVIRNLRSEGLPR